MAPWLRATDARHEDLNSDYSVHVKQWRLHTPQTPALWKVAIL